MPLKIWLLVYNNGTDTGAADGGGNNAGGSNANPNPNPPTPIPDAGQDSDKPIISQKKLDSILAEEKKKYQKQVQDQVTQLENLKKSADLSEKGKKELEGRIEELNNSLLTKEQLAQKEKDKLQKEYKTQVDSLSVERDHWRNNFTSSMIKRTILDAAIEHDAFSASQIVGLLETSARLVEDVDEDQKGLGTYQVKIKFQDEDKDGKPVTLDLTPGETVKRMKELADKYGNLFKSTMNNGIGGSNGKPSRDVDPSKMDHDQYREWRKSQGLGRKT